MRRARPKTAPPPESIVGDIKKEIPQEQLAAIGALTLAYNEAEACIDRLFAAVTGLDDALQLEIGTRMNGIDGIIEIINKGSAPFLTERELTQLQEALGKGEAGFKSLKTYRDCVIHARHLNPRTGVGVKVDRQAKVYEVLLNKKALNAAYDQLVHLRKELDEAVSLIRGARLVQQTADDDPKKEQIAAKAGDYLVRFRMCHSQRQSLPPLPEFPTELELLTARHLANTAQTAIVTGWYLNQQSPDLVRQQKLHPSLLGTGSNWVPAPPQQQPPAPKSEKKE